MLQLELEKDEKISTHLKEYLAPHDPNGFELVTVLQSETEFNSVIK